MIQYRDVCMNEHRLFSTSTNELESKFIQWYGNNLEYTMLLRKQCLQKLYVFFESIQTCHGSKSQVRIPCVQFASDNALAKDNFNNDNSPTRIIKSVFQISLYYTTRINILALQQSKINISGHCDCLFFQQNWLFPVVTSLPTTVKRI